MTSVVLYCLLALGIVTAAQACPQGCKCYPTSVDCHNGNLTTLHSAMLALPRAADIQHMRLDQNFISTIDSNTFSNFTSLLHLVLQMNEITHLPEDLFDSLKNLTDLYLDNNWLSFLPDELFRNLGNLSELFLNENRLTHLAPNTFSSLRNLKELYLHFNRLTSLTKGTFNGLDNLLVLSIGNNYLLELKQYVFEPLQSLQNLSLEHNQIFRLHGSVFARLPQLRNLWLYNNNLTKIEDTPFACSKTLNTIDLYNNRIVEISKKAFFGLYSLQNLFLGNNRLHNLEPEVFASLTELEVLELQDNHLQNLEERSLSTMTHLQELNIIGNPLSCSCPLKRSLTAWHSRRIQIDGACMLPDGEMTTDLSELFCTEDFEKINDSSSEVSEGKASVQPSEFSFCEEYTIVTDFPMSSSGGDMMTDISQLEHYNNINDSLVNVSEGSPAVQLNQSSFGEERIVASDSPTSAHEGYMKTDKSQLEDYESRNNSSGDVFEEKRTFHPNQPSFGKEHNVATDFQTSTPEGDMITGRSLADFEKKNDSLADSFEGTPTVYQNQSSFGEDHAVTADFPGNSYAGDITGLSQLEDYENKVDTSTDISERKPRVHPSQTSFGEEHTVTADVPSSATDMMTDISQLQDYEDRNDSAVNISEGEPTVHRNQPSFDEQRTGSADSLRSTHEDMITDLEHYEEKNDFSRGLTEEQRTVYPSKTSLEKEYTASDDSSTNFPGGDMITDVSQPKDYDEKNYSSANASKRRRITHPSEHTFDKEGTVSADFPTSPAAGVITDANQLDYENITDSSVVVSKGNRTVHRSQPSFGGERIIATDFPTRTPEKEDTTINISDISTHSLSPCQKKGGVEVTVFCFSCLYLSALLHL